MTARRVLESRAHAEGVNAAVVHRRCVKACGKARALLSDASLPFAEIDGTCEQNVSAVLDAINTFEKSLDETREYLDKPPGSED